MNYLKILISYLLRGYQLLISPWLRPTCRFEPSCSVYAATAFRTLPLGRASWLTIRRIFSCHPWHAGGFDPVMKGPHS